MVGARPFCLAGRRWHVTASGLLAQLMESDLVAGFEAAAEDLADIKKLKARVLREPPKPWPRRAGGARIAPKSLLQKLKDGNDCLLAQCGINLLLFCATGKSAKADFARKLLARRACLNERARKRYFRICAAEQREDQPYSTW